MKENKYYSEFSFWLPLGYILALGLFFTEDCERGPRALNREQTDEWRGLMQSVVLIYHVTGAKNVLPIYMHLRLINSAYLFLSGYGHFCYFWQTGDVSLVRFARVSYYNLLHQLSSKLLRLKIKIFYVTIQVLISGSFPFKFTYRFTLSFNESALPVLSFCTTCIFLVFNCVHFSLVTTQSSLRKLS